MDSVKRAYCSYLQTSLGAKTYNEFKHLLYSESDSLIQIIKASIVDFISISKSDKVYVCDIGGGDGKRISSILRHLYSVYGNNYILDFIEQSSVYTDDFTRNPVGHFCSTNIQTTMFDKAQLPPQSYDLVFLIHSIFAFNNGYSLKKVLNLRKPLGKIVVVSNAQNSFLGRLKKLVDEGFLDHRYEINDIELTLSQEGIEYFKFPIVTRFSLNAKMNSNDIRTLLEWITLGRFSDFSGKKKQEVYEYIRANSNFIEGRLEFIEDESAIIIPYNPQ